MRIYEWKPGSRIKSDPTVIGPYIERMDEACGGVTPDALLADAESAASPLHSEFIWDDREAAQEHRLNQARYILRSITVRFEEDKPAVRAFEPIVVRVEGQKERQSYEHIARIMDDEDKRRQLLDRAEQEIKDLERKYAALLDLSQEFAMLRAAVEQAKQRTLVPV